MAEDGLAATLSRVATFIQRFVILTNDQAVALALWVAHTHTVEAVDITPYLGVTSPVKRCGKSRTFRILSLLVHNPEPTANASLASLFRLASEGESTLLFDESDGIFTDKDDSKDLRSLINAGFERGQYAIRMGGQNMRTLERHHVFGAKAFAGIGDLPDTISDRAIIIRLQRKTRDEKTERFRRRVIAAEGHALRDDLADLLQPNIEYLAEQWPELPDELDDRAQDIWEPLLAIADLAGEPWTSLARRAAIALSTGDEREDDSLTALLLHDMKSVFEKSGDRIQTKDMLAGLIAIEESPWADWKGKPITANVLSRLLKPYRIKTMSVKVAGETVRGYKVEQFSNAFRVLPPVTDVTSVTPGFNAGAGSNSGNAGNAGGLPENGRIEFRF